MKKKDNNIISFPSGTSKLERQVEAILFAASEPLDIETIEKRVQTNLNITKILENSPLTFISTEDIIVELQKKKIINSNQFLKTNQRIQFLIKIVKW